VLNTHFLALILKLLKSNPVYSTAGTSSSKSSSSTSVHNLNQVSRYLCATVLALMLRYATFIQPPSIRTRDEHILATLLSLLREPSSSSSSSSRSSSGGGGSSNDHKLRKRVTAAFGEIVFYITAQEDDLNNKEFNANLGNTNTQTDSGIIIDNNNGEIQDKWILPNNITETLLKCLKEESDEVVKHYIIKTIENILSQGGIYYKKKITNLEIGQILLEISLTSHNESLQGTAAMAVVHMMILVFNAPFESAGLSGTTSLKTNVKTSPSRSSSNNNNNNNNNIIDPFTSPSLQTSAKFIFKLFEKMNFVSFLEVIKDGQIKLQQAFLNFFNVLLLFPFNHLSHSFLPFIEAIDFLFNNPAAGNNSPINGIAALTSPTKGQLNNNNNSSSLLTTANNFYSSPVFQQYLSEGVQRIGLLGGLPMNGTVQTIVNQFSSSYQSLSSIRNFFLKSSNSSLVLNLFKLIEQSPINIIRAKALLAYQLLCSHNLSFLSQLSERRLPAVLVRIIEPLIDQYDQFVTNLAGKKEQKTKNNNNTNTKATAENPAIQSNYLLKNCLSFLLFLKLSKMKCMKQIALLLEELSTLPVEMISSTATPGNGGLYGTPKQHHSSSDRSPLVTLHGKSPASPKVKGGVATPASPSKQPQSDLKTRQAQQEKLLFICRQLKYYSDILRAIITVISQPTLSRLLLAGQEIFLLELTNALRILPLVRTSLLSSHQTTGSAGGFHSPPPRGGGGMNARTNHQNNQNEILEALVLTEQACLAALESIAQVEIPENIEVFLSLPSSSAGSTILFETHSIPSDSLMNLLVPFQPNWLQWIKIVLFYLLPVINKLLTHPDGDIRVVVSSFIRKIVPFYYKCYCQYFILPPTTTTTTITTTNNNPIQSKQSQHGESFPSSNPSTQAAANGMILPINPLLSFSSPRNVSIGFHNHFEEMNYLTKLSFHNNPTILMDSLQGILSVSSSLLTEQAPIPQYIIRFLNDIFELFISSYRSSSSFLQQHQQSQQPPKGHGQQQQQIVVYQQQLHNFAHLLIQEIISVLKSSGTINVIIHLLKSTSTQLQQLNNNNNNNNNNPASDKDSEGDGSSQNNNNNPNNNNLSNSLDPQLLFLLRNLFEFNKETASLLLESDIGGSLSIAIIASVYHNIRFPFVHNTAIGSSSLINFDLLIPLMDLLHLILHSVLREISSASQPQQQQSGAPAVQRAEQHKKLINPLKAVTPALLLVIAYVDSYLLESGKAKPQRNSRRNEEEEQEDQEEEEENDPQEHLIKLHLLETSTRCLGILFDLFSDTITNQLIAKQSILLDNNNNNNNSSNNNILTPRIVFAKLIRNRQVILSLVHLLLLIFFRLILSFLFNRLKIKLF
jgi:hypothetical protein